MPTYEYECQKCHERVEAVQKGCGGELKKVFSPVGIAFKGTGFYKTDSRSSGGSSD